MARDLYNRVRRPSGLLLLACICLIVPLGWKVIGADAAGTPVDVRVAPASIVPATPAPAGKGPSGAAGDSGPNGDAHAAVAAAALEPLVLAAVKARSGTPVSLDPPASLPLTVGSTWRYFKGTVSAPPSGWNTVGFDDAVWFQGASGFGYGDGDDGTILSDMVNSYVSVYTRREFTIPSLAALGGLKLTIDYDDGFVAYVNGVEVARSASMGGTVGMPPAFNATAASHESVAGGGGPAEVFTIAPSSLTTGTNVIAIQVHNQSLGSSDLSLIPTLEVLNSPPDLPSAPSPANGQTGLSTTPELCVTVNDAEQSPLDVTFYGREASSIAGDPFTIIALPDTQYYAASYPATFAAQTQWIRDNRIGRNIVFATELGDCTDQGGIQAQWDNANAAFGLIENPVTTGLPDGIPYGVAVGNHDQAPNGAARSGADENATTTLYNVTFGKPRFLGRGYFGDNFPLPGFADSMDNHYELFSASGMDFIIFHLEWDNTSCSWPSDGSAPAPPLTTCQSVLTWMRDLLTSTYPNRRAIITTHFVASPTSGGTGTPAFSTQGQAIFDSIKTLPNVFMLLGGHLDQADHRTDLATDGHPIHSLISDYQTRPNGGDGWLRIMTFDPRTDTIHVETYSPTLDRFINKLNDGTPSSHADNLSPTENEITVAYDMDSGTPFAAVGTDSSVPAGSQACVTWPGRQTATTYEWYAVVSDGTSSTAGGRQSFTTTTTCSGNAECDDADPCTADSCDNSLCQHAAIANCCLSAADCDDLNVCTDDACTANACVHASNSASCSDGNVCTTADFCSGGSCIGGAAANCDDGNLCTTDSCATLTGCAHAYTPAPGCCSVPGDCNDGNPATADACVSNSCQNTAIAGCTTPADCNDNDVCTTDVCGNITGTNAFALTLDGINDCVKMGAAPGLNAAQFTLETWFKRNTSPGTAVSTGTGGITAVPLIAKGAAESESATLNMNYFLGLRDVGAGVWRLAADFEEGTGGSGPLGLNHPVTGLTTVTANVWHHAAATYDGATWKLYLDGVLDTTLAVNQPAASDSVQHFGIGTTSNSSGTATGFFGGKIDEVRVWNIARTQAQIQADKDREVTAGTGLIGRWGFTEGSGTIAADATSPAENGTLTNGPTWDGADKPAFGSGTCSWTPVSCDDGDVCTVDSCNAVSGCAHTAGNDGATCDDGDSCTDADACSGGVCAGLPNGTCCQTDLDCDDFNACTADACAEPNAAALSFDGTSQRVEFGATSTHPQLGLSRFTIEFWFQRSGAGTQTGYWSGGSTAVPLVTKGRGVGDGGTIDLNYFVGIDQAGMVVADFEQVEPTAGADNRVAGTTTILNDVWYHVAATYDGAALKLYLNGAQEGSFATTTTPRFDSAHRFAIATAWNDDPAGGTLGPAGFFQGRIDEVRVWDHARTASEILAGRDVSIESGPGLVARWGMNEGGGTVVADSVGAATGTVTAGQWVTTGLVGLGNGTCVFTPTPGAACDDGNLCLTGDTCDAGGLCQPGTTPLNCSDGNICTDDSCDNEQGCFHANNQAACNDGNACTQADMCDGGACVSGAPLFCDDGNPCNGAETCSPASGCNAGTPLSCDDGNPCTNDSCGAGGCVHTPVAAGTSCADGDLCNGAETCNAAGACAAGTPLTCNDGNVCTSDVCAPATGCVFTNNTASCDDGNACTQTDVCSSGVCAGSNPVVCDDANACTDDSCNPANGHCLFANDDTNACSDGNACTTGDTCSAGVCVGGGALACDDGNPCTDDTCAAGSGCVFTPDNTNSCSDANACNGPEVCSAGTCVAGVAPNCNDGVTCTSDTCDPVLGCLHAPAGTCDDGNACTTDSCAPSNPAALTFDGSNDYVTMGPAPGLNAAQFTIEFWFKRTAAGVAVSTGTGGITAVPLVSKGAAESEAATLNMNYFVGLRDIGSGVWKLAADFEEGPGGLGPLGLNHPVTGTTTVSNDVWYHVAATYDGSAWRLFLNGSLDAILVVNQPVSFDSTQHFGLGTTLTSTGTAGGFFAGQLDEVRVWSYARTQAQILDAINSSIRSAAGLLGRWGLDQGSGVSAADSTTPAENGVLTNGPTWASASLVSLSGCAGSAAPDGTACDDVNLCTTGDQCTAGVCGGAATAGCCNTAADCADANSCTTESCVGNQCVYDPVPNCCQTDAQCDDGSTCTAESCNTANDAAADLRAAADYVDLGQDATAGNFINNFGTSSFTLEGWFYADGLTTNLTSIFRAGRQGAFAQVVVQLRNDGGTWISGSVESSSGNQIDVPSAFTASAGVTLATWNHYALVVDRSIPVVRLYLNGNLVGTGTPVWLSSATINMPAGDRTVLGFTRDASGALINNYNGRVDEVRIWSYARTQAEIQASRTKELVAAPGLVHRWGFNEAGGAPLDDPGTFDGTFQAGASRITTALPAFGNDTCTVVSANEGGSCDDGDACTTGDVCGAGACQPGTPLVCDDGLYCNGLEVCNPASGCQASAPPSCDDGVACTADSCDESADSCVHNAAGCTADISGVIRYYRDGSLNVEPAARPVSDVGVGLSGTGPAVPDAATTGTNGAYGFTGKPINESYDVRPSRTGGSFGAVTSFDAALVARAVVSLISLSPNQTLAGDSSGNGTLSSFDASYIAQMAAGLITQLPAAASVGSDWFLVPVPSPAPNQSVTGPSPSTGVNGRIGYTPLAATAAGQDFLAGLFGDVSANWTTVAPSLSGGGTAAMEAIGAGGGAPPLRQSAAKGSAAAGRLYLAQLGIPDARTIQVAVRMESDARPISFDLEVGYDASMLTPISVSKGQAAASFTLTANPRDPGRVRISLFNPDPIESAGEIAIVTFKVAPGAGRTARLTLLGMADEGTLPLAVQDGRVRTGKRR